LVGSTRHAPDRLAHSVVHQLRGRHSAGYVGVSAHFALDNLTINEPLTPVPLPASVLLLGSGVLGLNALRRRPQA
jgi:hypothetical protein